MGGQGRNHALDDPPHEDDACRWRGQGRARVGLFSAEVQIHEGGNQQGAADMSYKFGQFLVREERMDYSGTCGNLASAVGESERFIRCSKWVVNHLMIAMTQGSLQSRRAW